MRVFYTVEFEAGPPAVASVWVEVKAVSMAGMALALVNVLERYSQYDVTRVALKSADVPLDLTLTWEGR